VHEEEAAVLEGVARALADAHAGPRRADVREDERRADLARQPVPATRRGGDFNM